MEEYGDSNVAIALIVIIISIVSFMYIKEKINEKKKNKGLRKGKKNN